MNVGARAGGMVPRPPSEYSQGTGPQKQPKRLLRFLPDAERFLREHGALIQKYPL